MAKLTSLDDLKSLLPEDGWTPAPEPQSVKTGYSGKPQKLDVRLDAKRRRGKTVTVISGFQSKPDELEALAQQLKKACAAGGQVLDNTIEIQGVHRAKVVEILKGLGYVVK